MLGKYSRGMLVRIPARFQDSAKKAVDVENVVVGIEHFDNNANKMIHLISETAMSKVGDGEYSYEYTVPPNLNAGNYIVRIKAKQPGSKSNIIEATDFFEITDSLSLTPTATISNTHVEPPHPSAPDPELVQRLQEANRANAGGKRLVVEDHVFDGNTGQPVIGTLVNVYEKASFNPKSKMNVKITSGITGSDGRWSVYLLPGDYIFSFVAPRMAEVREFRKVQAN
jgi:acetylornithine deacetylase/succinyl-diaminopimelate desuccinylase-like protein